MSEEKEWKINVSHSARAKALFFYKHMHTAGRLCCLSQVEVLFDLAKLIE